MSPRGPAGSKLADDTDKLLGAPAIVGTRGVRGNLGQDHAFRFVEIEQLPSGAFLRGAVQGKEVYLVLSGPGTVTVTVDGRLEKTVKVTTQNIYTLLSRPKPGLHDINLRFSPGVAGYAFTFG